ncbi:cupin domain-containing protein [Haloferax gibbonsii]|nr:hypothetical protein [Haloferax gibbonsii]
MAVPPLSYVQTFKDTKTHLNVDSGTVQHWCPITHEETGAFELGVCRFAPGSTGRIHPETDKYESGWDFVLMPSTGSLRIDAEGETQVLKQYDFAYLPDGNDHRIRNEGREESWAVWAAVPAKDTTDGPSTMEYIDTFEDIEEGTGADPEDIKRYWIPIAAKTIGVPNLEMGLIFRPVGTEVPYHQHDPLETKEAFVSLEGTMGVKGPERYYELNEYDAMYVPPSGRHSNRNIAQRELRYVFIETPAEPELNFI